MLTKFSTWKLISPAFILCAVFALFLFPQYQARMTEAAGEAISPLDTRFTYTAQEVHRDFEKLGDAGREIYTVITGRIDMAFPIVYGLLFVLLLAYILKRTTNPGSSWILLSLLPLLGVAFDYGENFNTLGLLSQFPDISEDAVSRGEKLTQIKHILLMLSVGLMLILALWLILRKAISGKVTTVKS